MRRLTVDRAPERGAIAMMVTVLLASGVLLGCAALSVDVGNLSAERRQLQNGADAAALSAAQDCAITVCPTATSSSLTVWPAPTPRTALRASAGPTPPSPRSAGPAPAAGWSAVRRAAGWVSAPTPSGGLPPNYVRVYTQTGS